MIHRALVTGILTGLFWWQLPDDTDAHIMERFSILFFVIIAQSNAVVIQCVSTFAKERQLMLREQAKGNALHSSTFRLNRSRMCHRNHSSYATENADIDPIREVVLCP